MSLWCSLLLACLTQWPQLLCRAAPASTGLEEALCADDACTARDALNALQKSVTADGSISALQLRARAQSEGYGNASSELKAGDAAGLGDLGPECKAYLERKKLMSPSELAAKLQRCEAESSPAGAGYAPNPRPNIPGAADTTPLSCRFGNFANDKKGTCCGLKPHFNWVVATCKGGESLFCRNLPACAREGTPNINYVASYQFNGSHWVLLDESSAGDLTDAGISGSFAAGTGWEKQKSKFQWQGGDWTTKFAPHGKGPEGPRGLTPPGALWILSADNFYYGAFYMLSQLTLNLQGARNPTGTNCWLWEMDAVEGSMGWVPQGQDMPGHLNQLYATNNAAISGCMPVAYTALQTNGGQRNFTFPTEFQAYCREHPKAAGCDFWEAGKNVWWSGGVAGTQRFENKWDQPYVFAVVIDQRGYWIYRWIPDADGTTGWPGVSRTSAARVLPARPHPVTDPRGLATDIRAEVPEAVILQPSLPPESACLRSSMEAVNFQFGSDALGAMAYELGTYSDGGELDGAQNWWAHFADTGQDQDRQYPLSIAGVPKDDLVHEVNCNKPSDFSCTCLQPQKPAPATSATTATSNAADILGKRATTTATSTSADSTTAAFTVAASTSADSTSAASTSAASTSAAYTSETRTEASLGTHDSQQENAERSSPSPVRSSASGNDQSAFIVLPVLLWYLGC